MFISITSMKCNLLVAAGVVVLLVSCSSPQQMPLSERIKVMADNVEMNIDNCSEDQLSRYNAKYVSLLEEYEANSATLSTAEHALVLKEIARYNGILLRRDVDATKSSIQEIIEVAPDAVSGFLEGFMQNGGVEKLTKDINDIVNSAVKAGEKLDSIFQQYQFDELQQLVE